MSIPIRCGACGQTYSLKDRFAGLTVTCSQCGTPMAVPGGQLPPIEEHWLVSGSSPYDPPEMPTDRPYAVSAPSSPPDEDDMASSFSWQLAVVGAAVFVTFIALVIGRGNAARALTGLILMAAGVFSIAGAAYGWNWFINHYKARIILLLFGRTGTRIFYGVTGTFFLAAGALVATGVIKDGARRKRFALPEALWQQAGAPHVPLPHMAVPNDGAVILVHDIPNGLDKVIFERLKKLSGARFLQGHSTNDSETTIVLSPVWNVSALAGTIDFGKVEEVDEAERRIVIRADASKLPEPLAPEVSNPFAADFYRQNLADINCWDRERRQRAVERFRTAQQPNELRAEIAAALIQQLKQPSDQDNLDYFTRDAIVEMLPKWATADEAMPILIALFADNRVAHRAIDSLGRLRDARAVEPLLRVAGQHGFQVHGALRKIGESAETPLLAHVNDPDENISKLAIRVLGEVGTEQSEPVLKEIARRGDFFVRSEAEAALKNLRRRNGD